MKWPVEIVAAVRQRAKKACEYCSVTEVDAAGRLTLDHYQPRSRGGSDDLDNLVYCCFRCNNFKGDYWPVRADDLPVWHPRRAQRETHLLELANGRLHPVTPTGAFTLNLLHLN